MHIVATAGEGEGGEEEDGAAASLGRGERSDRIVCKTAGGGHVQGRTHIVAIFGAIVMKDCTVLLAAFGVLLVATPGMFAQIQLPIMAGKTAQSGLLGSGLNDAPIGSGLKDGRAATGRGS